MLFHQAKKEIADLEQNIVQGNFLPLKNWLNDRVHQCGRQFTASELLLRVTGQTITSEPFIQDLEDKFGNLYQFPTRPHAQSHY